MSNLSLDKHECDKGTAGNDKLTEEEAVGEVKFGDNSQALNKHETGSNQLRHIL